MTFGEGKIKVLMLLDEYSSGGAVTEDLDINNKMSYFFDMAQKDMTQYQPIVATADITLDATQIYTNLPSGFQKNFRTWKNGEQIKNYPIVGNKLRTNKESGTVTLEYIKYPDTITSNTADSYVFEVNEAAANCLPFYVASQQLITDLVVDYGALWNMYLQHRADLPDNMSELCGGRVMQRLFGGR